LTTVRLPNGVTNIPVAAFYSCINLTNATIPNSVASIDNYAFKYCASLVNVTIPASVRSLGTGAFAYCSGLTNITIGDRVSAIGDQAFVNCTNLTGVYFQGNAPSLGSMVFEGVNHGTAYFLPGTIGWGSIFGGLPTATWVLPRPWILNTGPGFGVQSNGFGFVISWATNTSVQVEASTSLAPAFWSPLGTNTLSKGSSYFSDPQWTNYPSRFYRIRSL